MAVYTSADWHVKPGREKEFVDAWREIANWSGTEYDLGGWAKLLKDKEDPTHFRSVGEWANDALVAKWRASDALKQRLATINELLDDMHLYTMDVAAEVQTD